MDWFSNIPVLVKALLNAGANPSAKMLDGSTAHDLASKVKDTELADMLRIEHNMIDPDMRVEGEAEPAKERIHTEERKDSYIQLIEKNPFDANVPSYLRRAKGMVNYGRPHLLTQWLLKLTQIKDGFFRAIGFESGFYAEGGSEELTLAGPV